MTNDKMREVLAQACDGSVDQWGIILECEELATNTVNAIEYDSESTPQYVASLIRLVWDKAYSHGLSDGYQENESDIDLAEV